MVCPQPRSVPYVGLSPALCPAAALAMKPPSVQSPFARRRRYRHRRGVYRLLRGHCSSVFARMDSSANPEWLSCASAAASLQESLQVATRPLLPPGSSRRYLCESFLRCLVPCRGGPTECTCLFLPPCHRPCPTGVWVGFPLQPANTTFHGASFGAADISLCSGLRVCSPPRSFLPLRLPAQGSRGFYVRAYRASLPPHAPDMLAARIQAIGGVRTFTRPDSQPCRLLPPVYASLVTSRWPPQNSGPSGSLPLSREDLASSAFCRFIPALPDLRFCEGPRLLPGDPRRDCKIQTADAKTEVRAT